MNEHLFKLKKNGKAVGLIELYQNGNLRLQYDGTSCPWTHIGWQQHLSKFLEEKKVTSIHPFVTKDKNGKDVFEGDKVKAVIPDVSSDSLVGTIIQNENPLACWMFKYRFDEERFGEKEHLAPAPDLQNIELIEDNDNE